MKLMSFEWNGTPTYGVVHENGNRVWDVPALAKAKNQEVPDSIFAGIQESGPFYATLEELVR
ncbi:hypothetical protein JOC94_004526 [Bacillus thermophilus]|uniref:Uncharacterized protein n=1 Tax=Siminovitchia thermophila TaxID=1245522 RepID=A0ABS2RCX7_9BACI|nr:hypothetical protein [Siminovitchia thermophila]MBM7717497.1 hypothetical protein [Siminovitchia thermophila]